MTNTSVQLRMTVYSALMAALIAAGAFVSIPIGPVPIVLQNMFVLIAAVLLGRNWGFACVAIYLLAGAIGLPVFASGKGGFAHFAGPTGGYLLSYMIVAVQAGWMADIFKKKLADKPLGLMISDFITMLIGSAIIYAVGVPWLKTMAKLPWEKAFALGMFPFVPGDLLKIVAATLIVRIVRPLVDPDQETQPV